MPSLKLDSRSELILLINAINETSSRLGLVGLGAAMSLESWMGGLSTGGSPSTIPDKTNDDFYDHKLETLTQFLPS